MAEKTSKSQKIKSNLSLYSLYYAEACNELAGPISASLRPGNTAPFKEMSQRWRAVGNTVSDLTGLRFEPQTSRSRDERVTARPTGRSLTARPTGRRVETENPETTQAIYSKTE